MSIARTAAAEYEHVLVPLAVGAPVVLETALFAKNAYQKPHKVGEAYQSLKASLIDSVTQRDGETTSVFHKRLAFNVLKAVAAILFAGAVAYAAFMALPLTMAIPLAFAAIYYTGKFVSDPGRLGRYLQEKKVEVIDAFTKRTDEADSDYRWRCAKNVGKGIGYAALATGVIAMTVIGVPAVLTAISDGMIWAIPELMPGQTPLVVFLEYGLIGAIHGVMAINSYRKGDKADATFHTVSALLSIVFPLWYLLSPVQEMRLHHSFIGLALGLAPWRPVRMLGSFIALDSLLYALSPVRVDQAGESYDFMNSIIKYSPAFTASMATATVLEDVNKRIFEEKEKEKKQDEASSEPVKEIENNS